MADRRRRRRRASQDSEDEDGSGSDSGRSGSPSSKARGREPVPEVAVVKSAEAKSDVESECESEDGVGEAVLSDYDSADPEEHNSHSEGGEEEDEAAEKFSDEEVPAREGEPPQPVTGELTEQQQEEVEETQQQDDDEEEEREGRGPNKVENKVEEKGNLAGERQSGDGQESTDDPETKAGGKPGQKLDDDEDRKNPAYIPRKGLFFEHDVRGHAQEEERPKGRNRRLWKDEGRWEHDKFREEEQAPKSQEELIAIYGYDIRNGGGGPGERQYRNRRPRQNSSPSRDKRWRDGGGDRPVRSWHSGGGGGPGLNRGGAVPPSSFHPSSSVPPHSAPRGGNSSRSQPPRRPPHQTQMPLPPQPSYRSSESNAPHMHSRERLGPRAQPESDRAPPSRTGRGGSRGPPAVVMENTVNQGGPSDQDLSPAAVPIGSVQTSPRGPADRSASGLAVSSSEPALQSTSANREASPPAERPVERKSYSLARRTRSRPADLGSKQTSMEESAVPGSTSSPSGGAKNWAGDAPGQGGGGVTELDQDVARLSLSGQSWSQSSPSYLRAEMRGLPNPLHLSGAPPQFSSMEEIGVGSNRAKRYSSQRQRTVPEPAPPLHLGGMMEGHYYEPMSYQGPIYGHGEAPGPLPPQGLLVQSEMHLPHPGLHPHQSAPGPIANPALYGAPPVSLSPGQPQQLLPPPFYPPPGVMTFPYPTMYPTPQGQSQVTYGGVTYYDTMQQQAQPKPSPPRRTSQPVTVKPPPPEVPFASE